MRVSIKLKMAMVFGLLFFGLSLAMVVNLEAKQLVYTISASGDDSRCVDGDCSYFAEGSATFPYSSPSVVTFFRWPVKIPRNATITSAYLKVFSAGGYASPSVVNLDYIAQDSYTSFTPTLPVGGGPITWTMGAWSQGGQYTSPDIAPLVRSFIARPGYRYGNYFGLRGAYSSGIVRYIHMWDYGDHTKGATLEVNYTGGDPMVELWMAEPHVRTKQYLYVQLGNIDVRDSLHVTLDGNNIPGYPKTFSSAVLKDGEETVLVDYTGLSAGNHTISVTIKTATGVTRGTPVTKTWRTLHNGYPKVGINENNALCIRNQAGTGCDLFFPITAFMHNKEFFPSAGSHRINPSLNSLTLVGWYPSHTILTWKDYLNSANSVTDADTGMRWKVIGPGRGQWTDIKDYAAKMTNKSNCTSPLSAADCSYVNYTKDHEALLGWMWGDEYDMYGVAATVAKNDLDNTHANDTDHPLFMNLYGYDYAVATPPGTYAPQYMFLYNRDTFDRTRTVVTDVIAHDYYPYEFAGASVSGLPISLENYLSSIDNIIGWNYGLLPFIPFVEPQDENDPNGVGHLRGGKACGHALSNRGWTPDPTAAQIINNVWVSIIHGAKGIFYFGPDLFCSTLQYEADATRAFKIQMNILTPVVLQAPSARTMYRAFTVQNVAMPLEWAAASVTGDGRVDYTVRDYQGRTWIFAARVPKTSEGWPNGNIPTQTATFNLSGFSATETLNVYGENRTVTATNGQWSDAFAGFDVHIYYTGSQLTGPIYPAPPPPGSPLGPPSRLRVVE